MRQVHAFQVAAAAAAVGSPGHRQEERPLGSGIDLIQSWGSCRGFRLSIISWGPNMAGTTILDFLLSIFLFSSISPLFFFCCCTNQRIRHKRTLYHQPIHMQNSHSLPPPFQQLHLYPPTCCPPSTFCGQWFSPSNVTLPCSIRMTRRIQMIIKNHKCFHLHCSFFVLLRI
jgi:hypothetical protein